MPLFEVDPRRSVHVQALAPGSPTFAAEAGAVLDDHVSRLLGEQIFPVAQRPEGAEAESAPYLLALDAAGQPVVIEMVSRLDAATLALALAHAGRAGRLTRPDIAARYPDGVAAFEAAFAEFRQATPIASTRGQHEGSRLLLLCAHVDPAVADALEFLRLTDRAVTVLRLGVVTAPDGRKLVEVEPLQGRRPEGPDGDAPAERGPSPRTSAIRALPARGPAQRPGPVRTSTRRSVARASAEAPSERTATGLGAPAQPATPGEAAAPAGPGAPPGSAQAPVPPAPTRRSVARRSVTQPVDDERPTAPMTVAGPGTAHGRPTPVPGPQAVPEASADPSREPSAEPSAESSREPSPDALSGSLRGSSPESSPTALPSAAALFAAADDAEATQFVPAPPPARPSALPVRTRAERRRDAEAARLGAQGTRTSGVPGVPSVPTQLSAPPSTTWAGASDLLARAEATWSDTIGAGLQPGGAGAGRPHAAGPHPEPAPAPVPTLAELGTPDPDLVVLAQHIGHATSLVWSRPRRRQLFEAVLLPSGVIEVPGQARYRNPDAAASAVVGAPREDGWDVWRIGVSGPSLTELFREQFA